MKQVLVTGCAGFIGFHLSRRLLSEGVPVVGLDNLNAYYDVSLKEARLKILSADKNFFFHKADISDAEAVRGIFKQGAFDTVAHLAAQAGVRYSLTHPEAYIQSNEVGFFNVLEASKNRKVGNFVFASTSSVYGANTKTPFSESDPVEQPITLYAATKRGNELTAKAYSHLFGLPCTALRFFTVYGPYGRPDMALFKFTKGILAGEPIDVYNHGKMTRDFTFVEDIVSGIVAALRRPQPYAIYNLGNHKPVELLHYIACIEKELGKKAVMNLMPMQAGDIAATCADISKAKQDLGYAPKTGVEEGIRRFVEWYRAYFKA